MRLGIKSYYPELEKLEETFYCSVIIFLFSILFSIAPRAEKTFIKLKFNIPYRTNMKNKFPSKAHFHSPDIDAIFQFKSCKSIKHYVC